MWLAFFGGGLVLGGFFNFGGQFLSCELSALKSGFRSGIQLWPWCRRDLSGIHFLMPGSYSCSNCCLGKPLLPFFGLYRRVVGLDDERHILLIHTVCRR